MILSAVCFCVSCADITSCLLQFVSKETFAKAEERLKKNVAHRKTRSDSTTVYPLTGLIRCPDCGKNIFGYTAPPRKKKNGKEGYYPRYIS